MLTKQFSFLGQTYPKLVRRALALGLQTLLPRRKIAKHRQQLVVGRAEQVGEPPRHGGREGGRGCGASGD